MPPPPCQPVVLTQASRTVQGETFNKKDGYSAFASSHPEHADKSHVSKLLIDNKITHLFICGLATDACVKASANHALEDRLSADIAWDVFLIKEVRVASRRPGDQQIGAKQ